MSEAERAAPRTRWWPSAAAGFLPGLALALLPAAIAHPAALAGWIVAQPLLAAAAARALGVQFEADMPASAWLRGVPALIVLLGGALLAALLLAAPLWRLLATGALPWVLATSAAATAAWLLLWRAWPAPALPFLCERIFDRDHANDADDEPGAPWPFAPALLSMRYGRRLVAAEDGAGRGLFAAALWLLLVAVPPVLAWLAPLPADARVLAWAVAACFAAAAHALIIECGTRALAVSSARQTTVDASVDDVVEAAAPDVDAAEALDPLGRLYRAARAGRVDEALSLLDAVDVRAPPPPDAHDQRTLTMLAVLIGDLRLLRELIARGAPIDAAHAGLTPLLVATRDSYHGRPEAVTTLLANGADPRQRDGEGNTPLHFAARSSDPGVAAQLIDAGAEVDAVNRAGWTPLAEACACGNWRLARFLIERGARAEPADAQPALLAAVSGEDDAAGVQLLVKHRADADRAGRFGRTPLLNACLAGNADCVAALLDAGADADRADERGVTPLMESARAGANRVLDLLAARRPDPAAVDAAGRDALVIACQSQPSDADTVRRLLALGVDRDRRGTDGRCALDHAVAGGRWALVAALDPTYPLPASLSADDGRAALLPVERLAASLRRHDFADAAAVLVALDADAIAAALDGVIGEDDVAAAWLAAHMTFDGDAARDAQAWRLLGRGADAGAALGALLDRGAQPTGAGGLARYLDACERAEHTARGCEAFALRLAEHGADPLGAGRAGDTPLTIALRLGWLRLAGHLLAAGVDPNARDARGATALHVACALGREPAVRLLVRFGADAHARGVDGQTPLGLALAAGRDDLARWLGWSGWQPPSRRLREDDVVAAAVAGDLGAARRLIELGLPIEARDAQGCTPLLRAAGSGHLPLLRWLLDAGADPNAAAHSGATCLSAAVSTGRLDIVDALLDGGARPDAPLPGGATALMIAAALGQPEIARRLLDAGADAAACDEQGNTALLAAAQHAFGAPDARRALASFDALLDAGAAADSRVDHANAQGDTALLLALGSQRPPDATCDESLVGAIVDRLLARGARVDGQDRRGFGPLHLAALHGLPRVLHTLLQAGADRDARDALNRTPHDIATLRGFVDIAQAFEPPRPAPSIARFLRAPGER